jgi:hypothetical protein
MAKTKPHIAKGVKFISQELMGGGYHPFITVTIEGKKCRFLIDTGASKCVIDKDFYEKKLERKMKVIKQETTGLHSTVMESYVGTLKKLQLGDLILTNYPIAGVELTHVNLTYGKMKIKKIHGILGSDIFQNHNAIIDYAQSKLFI